MSVPAHPTSQPARDQRGYHLLPLRFARIPGLPDEVLITSETGEFLFLPATHLPALVRHELGGDEPFFEDLVARHFIHMDGTSPSLDLLSAQYRTRKSFIAHGPGLHIFVVTLRCDHSCLYCQVSRRGPGAERFDMPPETAGLAVERMFETPSRTLTVEFQGGESLLAFDRIQSIVELVSERNSIENRNVRFVVATTLHHLTDQMLEFFRAHDVYFSTSIDGPAWLHNQNRPNRTEDSFRRTIEGIRRVREALGPDHVDALLTLTKASLDHPREIIDTYVENDLRSIFLRPVSPYGFAQRNQQKIGYPMSDFLRFYRAALDYLIHLNAMGVRIVEAYTSLLLQSILTPFPHQYVDLRSPAGAGLGVLVYNYDGDVYASDEARMLAEMGDKTFRLGKVDDPYRALLASDAMAYVLSAGVAESLPGCTDCAFLPYCGADPVDAWARQGDPIGHRPTSDFCRRQTGMFEVLFSKIRQREEETTRVLLSWLTKRDFGSTPIAGYFG